MPESLADLEQQGIAVPRQISQLEDCVQARLPHRLISPSYISPRSPIAGATNSLAPAWRGLFGGDMRGAQLCSCGNNLRLEGLVIQQ